jgi:8-oxo-dGTP diphosphatase
MTKFHYLARAVAIQGGSILLVRAKGATNTFLPGGHIEFAETAHNALKRELLEEIGYDIAVGEFLGAVEHLWPESSRENHEINLVFAIKINSLPEGANPLSKEEHLDLFWARLSELEKYNLQPRPLVELINRRCSWGSTLDGRAIKSL